MEVGPGTSKQSIYDGGDSLEINIKRQVNIYEDV